MQEGDEKGFDRLREGMAAAIAAGDVDSYVALFDEHATVMPPNQPAVSGREAIRSWAQGLLGQFVVRVTVLPEELVVAGDWAFERHNYVLTVTPKTGGETIQEAGKAVAIGKRQPDGTWKGYIDCWNSNGPPAST